jgi:penicillin-insensitive murein endopeptidase
MNAIVMAVYASLLASSSAIKSDNPWADVQTPTKQPAQIYGTYGAGCIAGAKALPLNGLGYQIVHPSRNRMYGHPNLLSFAQEFTSKLSEQKIVMLAADVALARGGPMPEDHASHNVGLDIDFWFKQDSRALTRILTAAERETIEPIALADLDKNELLENVWNWRYETILKTAASDPRVERIFVHPTIKKRLCANPNNQQDWLRKIRPWWGHNYHFHTRLACPKDSPNCVPQEPAQSIACDETLDWWFSDEWREEYEKRKRGGVSPGVIPLPALPAACDAVLTWEP